MQKGKWLLKTGVMLTLASSLMAGCGSSSKEGTSSISPSASPADTGKPVPIEFTLVGTGNPASGDDYLKQAIDQTLNIDLQINPIQSFDDYKNKIRVRLAANNRPDLFVVDQALLKDLSDKDMLLDLTPYWDKQLKPAKDFIVSNFGEIMIKKGNVNGKSYAIPRSNGVPYTSFWIRKDWLDHLNLQMPTTLDELFNVLKAFTENDPDGNGQKDTYGLTGLGGAGTTLGAFMPIFGAYGTGYPGNFIEKDGKLENTYYDPNMPEALKYIKKLIDAKVIDPDIITNNGLNEVLTKLFQGKAGVAFLAWPDIAKDAPKEQIKAINPKAEWIQMDPPKGPGGQFNDAYDFDATASLYAIPKALEKEPQKLQKVFDLINYVSSKEGNMLALYGVEGRHYNMTNGKMVPTDLQGKEGGYFWMYQITSRPHQEYLAARFPNLAKEIEFAIKTPRLKQFNSSVIAPDGFNKADADRYSQEELVKFVYGKRPIEEYGDFLKTLETTYKYKTYVESGLKQIRDQGLSK
ncbi:MAG: transporter substrate-binding protein [Paenibacillaceae bacterium]|jgi:putative aldouronate transport system substrate-binding protein|nr:transporter substrate-binding protein [Paenibacillaceae bacterium]